MRSITLIGMAGAGKSVIGKKLAERRGMNFVDLDILIHEREGSTHSTILQTGDNVLTSKEELYTIELNLENTIFSPGGSIVYSSKAMKKVKRETITIYLEANPETIKKRIGHLLEGRGVVGLKEKGLEKLMKERAVLYEKYADHTVNCDNLNEEEVLKNILTYLR